MSKLSFNFSIKDRKTEKLADTLLGLFKNINKCLEDRK